MTSLIVHTLCLFKSNVQTMLNLTIFLCVYFAQAIWNKTSGLYRTNIPKNPKGKVNEKGSSNKMTEQHLCCLLNI